MSGADERHWTVVELLQWTTGWFEERGVASPRLDAECLLAHALGCERLRLYLDFDKSVPAEERGRFRELVRRRGEERVPVAQLTGSKEFWSLRIEVTPDVLVPRPETEGLVEAALGCVPDREAEVSILEIGTGSGAVALALASELPKARITATDLSPEALAVAKGNAERLDLGDRVRFLEGDLFEPVAGERFDLVVSNPPYVAETAESDLAPELGHEPRGALFGGADGLSVLTRIAAEAPGFLEPGGALCLELGSEQSEALGARLAAAGLAVDPIRQDLAGRPRIAVARAAREAPAS